ncbi:MAG: GT4 family glycosyltransferase PelF [Anaerolineae bacterium]|nr:GT4 family glycosyltransferase PelF [Anaerolineae bacterium]
MKRSVLLIDFAPSPGGSIVSLYGLARGLRDSPYAPLVLLAPNNPLVPQFRSLGVGVFTLDARQGQGDLYAAPVERVRRSMFADWVRRSGPAAAIWHGGGFWLRLGRRILPQAWRVARLAKAQQVCLIHCNDAVSISRVGILAARLARLPCVCFPRRFDRLGRFERWLARSVDYFVFNSGAVQRQFLEQGERPVRQRVVHNGLDLDDFPLDLDGRAVRQELGLTPEAPVVGIVGRLVDWKGHDVFLRALARVAEEWPDVQGLVVGSPEVACPHLVQELQQLAVSLGLGEAVRFVGHRPDIARVLAAMDLLVHASIAPEPFGRVLIEGMAAAKPVVASAAGGVPEIVLDGQTGLLVEPGDVQGFAQAILSLLRHPEQAAALGRAGRQRVEAYFTIERYVRQVQEVYGAVLGDQ